MWGARDEEEIRGAGSRRGHVGLGVVWCIGMTEGEVGVFFCLHVCVRGGGGC